MDLAIIIAILVAYNIIVNRFLEEKWHILFSLLISVTLIWWVVRFADINLGSIGAQIDGLVPGLVYGALSFVIISLAIGLASVVPVAKSFFGDERVIRLRTRQLLYKTLVNIPLGTVLLEEVVFRGVMLALLTQNFSTVISVLVSSLLFGFWHVLPAITNVTSNKKLKDFGRPKVPVVLGTVFITFIAGVAFSWLRLASGSLIAPMLAHYATNSGGVIAAWWLHNFNNK